jgi:hypothetical protein
MATQDEKETTDMERIVLKRKDLADEVVLMEAGVKAINLTHAANRMDIDYAASEFLGEVRREMFRHKQSFDAAMRFVQTERPLLFKLARLNPVDDDEAADVVIER